MTHREIPAWARTDQELRARAIVLLERILLDERMLEEYEEIVEEMIRRGVPLAVQDSYLN